MLQKHLARLLGHLNTRSVSHYEGGTALPPLKTAVLLEVALGVRLQELYPDLYQQCEELVAARAEYLPPKVRKSLMSRLLQKDLPHEHPGTG